MAMDPSNPEFKRNLLLLIAGASGILAMLFIYSYISAQKAQSLRAVQEMQERMRQQTPPPQQTVSVLFAAKSVEQGMTISSSDVVAKEIPKEFAVQGYIPASMNIIGLSALAPITAGEQLLQSKVGRPEKPKLLSALTPPGKRAVTIQSDNSLAGLLEPGDYVDVLAVLNPPAGSPLYSLTSNPGSGSAAVRNPEKVTIPLFQNVLVLAIGTGTTKKTAAAQGSSGDTSTVTLSLSPQEAALVAFVQEQGKLKLVMRGSTDVSDTNVETVNWDSLFEYLYPGTNAQRMKRPATVEVYRGLQKETVSLSGEGQTK